MATYGEYTTVNEVRAQYLASTQSTDDAQILDFIRAASRSLDNACRRHFFPIIQTRFFNVPGGGQGPIQYQDNMKGGGYRLPLYFDEDLLEITTVTNGDGSSIASTEYNLRPYNFDPKHTLAIKRTSSTAWLVNSAGEFERVISVLGVWGCSDDYANAWQQVTTLSTAITTTGQTSVTVPTGTVKAGWLLKIDSEYLYVSAVTTGATDTLTIVRGVNGSTAATHTSSTAVYWWNAGESITNLVKRAAAGLYKLKSNPVADTVVIDGNSFVTPKDILAYISTQAAQLGIIRIRLPNEEGGM